MYSFKKTCTINDGEDCIPEIQRLSLESSCTAATLATVVEEDDFQEDSHSQEDEEDFYDFYQLGKLLGEGGYGKVHQCFATESCESSQNEQRQSFAVKVMKMEQYDHDEIEILQDLMDCPNVTQVMNVFADEEEAYIVMEEMRGGDLLDRLVKKECYTEEEAKPLFQNLLQTLQFCHSRGIVHGDIKPENILLRSKESDSDMQLADFGLAQRFVGCDGHKHRLYNQVGTMEYVAPEIIHDEGYDESVDVWSCGVVLYILLGGYQPFDPEDQEKMMEQICSGSFKFHEFYWRNVSQEAKDLISMMLTVDPAKRCSLEEALNSQWFSN